MATSFTKIDRKNLAIDFAPNVSREDIKRRQRVLKQHHYAITFTYRVVKVSQSMLYTSNLKPALPNFNWGRTSTTRYDRLLDLKGLCPFTIGAV